MSTKKRRKVIAGNWKMNMTPTEAKELAKGVYEQVKGKKGCDVVVCVPFVDIPAMAQIVKGTIIKLGAQNVHFEEKGAYTGEISANMLKDCGVQYVIVGHSERREYFGETDETVNKRAKAALNAGLTAIICVGEKNAASRPRWFPVRSNWPFMTFPKSRCRMSSSPMNRFGQSAPAKPPQTSRQTRSAALSARWSAKSTASRWQNS